MSAETVDQSGKMPIELWLEQALEEYDYAVKNCIDKFKFKQEEEKELRAIFRKPRVLLVYKNKSWATEMIDKIVKLYPREEIVEWFPGLHVKFADGGGVKAISWRDVDELCGLRVDKIITEDIECDDWDGALMASCCLDHRNSFLRRDRNGNYSRVY